MELWRKLSDDQVISVELSDGEMAYCSIIGNMGRQYGIVAYLGDDGLYAYQSVVEGNDEVMKEMAFLQKSLTVLYGTTEDMEMEDFGLLSRHTFPPFKGNQFPIFRRMDPGYLPWPLTQSDVEKLIVILSQVNDVIVRSNENKVQIPDSSAKQWVGRQQANEDGEWTDTLMTPEPTERKHAPRLAVSETDLQRIKKSAQPYNGSVELGVFYIGMAIQGETAGEPPSFASIFAAMEINDGMNVFFKPGNGGMDAFYLQHTFLNMVEKIGLPQKVFLKNDKVSAYLSPLLKKLSVEIVHVPRLPYIEEMREQMEKDL